MRIVSIGEILWDVIGSTEYLGGAPFNLCAHLTKLGHEAIFISAVGDDERGARARRQADALGIATSFLATTSQAATGISEVTLDAEGKAHHRLPRPAAYDFVSLSEAQCEAIVEMRADWICFGTLLEMEPRGRDVARRLLRENIWSKRFYDVNLRPRCWTSELARELMHEAHAVKLNEDEAQMLSGLFDWAYSSYHRFCEALADRFRLETVCVTRGAQGCALLRRGEFAEAPGFSVTVADTVGAGDAFSAALLHGLNQEWPLQQVAEFANRVGALVASRHGATPAWTLDEALALQRS